MEQRAGGNAGQRQGENNYPPIQVISGINTYNKKTIMTLKQFIAQASKIKDELQDKELVIQTENGILLTPKIKFIPKGMCDAIPFSFLLDAEHIDKVIITFD